MKDKYDNIKLEDINANQLFQDIKNEVDITLLHLDTLQAITSSDCFVLELNKAFKKINDALKILSAFSSLLGVSINGTYIKLDNRFQKENDKDT